MPSVDSPLASSADHELLEILSNEIHKDGGITMATALKDHLARPRHVDRLLVQSIGSKGLLTFCRRYPAIFRVDTSTNMHLVHLIQNSYVTLFYAARKSPIAVAHEDNGSSEESNNDTHSNVEKQHLLVWDNERYRDSRDKLLQYVSIVMRKRQAKLIRRQKNQGHERSNGRPECSLDWLIRQCRTPAHAWLRETNFYVKHYGSFNLPADRASSDGATNVREHSHQPSNSDCSSKHEGLHTSDGQKEPRKQAYCPVGSTQWARAVLPAVKRLLQQHAQERYDIIDERNQICISAMAATVRATTEAVADVTSEVWAEEEAKRAAAVIMECLRQDGGTQMKLSLLIHRYSSVKECLGGRDFSGLVKAFPVLFDGLAMKQIASGDVELRMKDHPTINMRNAVPKNDKDSTCSGSISQVGTSHQPPGHSRMAVDHQGLYSVTASKWSTAIANIMVWSCTSPQSPFHSGGGSSNGSGCGKYGKDECDEPHLHPTVVNQRTPCNDVVAVDLTASVGGMTLGLAKTNYFQQVIAIEIDPIRAELCQHNMTKHGFSARSAVDVRNMDAMSALPVLADERTHGKHDQSMILVMDPPWGGIDYKQEDEVHSTIRMGRWSLNEVIAKCFYHLTPAILGLRLPVTFVVKDWMESLRKEFGITPVVMTVRKLGPQLFVVITLGKGDGEVDGGADVTFTDVV